MTFAETIVKTHRELLDQKIEPNNDLDTETIEQMINDSENIDYAVLCRLDHEKAILKLLINAGQEYGRIKFQEGVDAAKLAMVEENPCPPVFKP